MPHTCYKLGDGVTDISSDMYYRGQRIKEAYYRGEKIWGDEFIGILLVRLPDKLHYPSAGTLLGIEVTRLPDKTKYEHGDEFDYSGALITANYTDDNTVDITSQCTFIPATEMLSGNVTTSPPIPDPHDELIDYAGIKVLGIWSSSYTEDITSKCEFYPPEGTAIDKSTALLGILVATPPNKTTYHAGESFDYSGVAIVAVYADGHMTNITSECTFSRREGTLVNPVTASRLLVTRLPTGTEDNSYDGVEVKLIYSNGKAVVVTDNCTFSRE